MKKRIVYAAGVFDPLHYGHVRYLGKAKSLGDILVVGVLTDAGAAAYKDRPIMDYDARVEVVKALSCVDYTVSQADTDPTLTLETIAKHGLCPDILCRGDDYPGEPPGTEFMKEVGGIVVKIPYCKEISSTIYKQEAGKRYGSSRQRD